MQNKYQMKPLPFVPGSEFAGTVIEAVGEGVTHLQVGQSGLPVGHRRLWHPHPGPGSPVHTAASRFPFVDAAAFIMIYATSTTRWWIGANSKPVKPCWCWAQPGRGHGGHPDRQGHGCPVIAAASTDEKCALCTSIGRRRHHQLRSS